MKQILFTWFAFTNTYACITGSINVNNSLMLSVVRCLFQDVFRLREAQAADMVVV
ncbi:hypothetical protein SM62_00752 [Klebsiella variicola]|uniref:hypothetical protein n=1 Tax=Klebsiella variicola TaxID=244366 RepID=UPI0006590B48|nr:hypothetical protein [Klebsiella variicola]KMH15078.1 hypothetical protein SM62_00752 [Klebsiella variicola]